MSSKLTLSSSTIKLDRTKARSEKRLYDYQEKAINELESKLFKQDKQAAVLVIPTGGGKTYTAIYWAFTKFVPKGYKIVWIAHRTDLLEQAKKTMNDESGLLKGMDKDPTVFMIGGGYNTGKTLATAKNEIIIVSIQSLSNNKGIKSIATFCKKNANEKILFIIDEAHHSPAFTYKRIINANIKENKNFKLLGLTATPTRTAEKEKLVLANLYDRNFINGGDINDLINRGFLSRPIPVVIDTDISFEKESAPSEATIKFFEQKHELNPEYLRKIGSHVRRNKIIVETYIKNKDKYKKTLIFAIDIAHAITLHKEFVDKKVKAGLTYAGKDGHEAVIRNFADNKLDVLINISKLTEGFDDPKIQTVFLTRPTQSEILFSQMIGRGLRSGKQGTTEAYLVSFEDHWDKFTGWLQPAKYLNYEGIEIEDKEKKPTVKTIVRFIPVTVINEFYSNLRSLLSFEEIDCPAFSFWPLGWYNLEIEAEGVPTTRPILVFSHQKESWDEVIKLLPETKPVDLFADKLYNEWFEDLPAPSVNKELFDLFIDTCYAEGDKVLPEYYLFEDRDNASPDKLAKELFDNSIGGIKKKDKVSEWFKTYPVLASLYNSEGDFARTVDQSIHILEYPEDERILIASGSAFLPEEKKKFEFLESNDDYLRDIVDELSKDSTLFPQGFKHNVTIKWTHRPMQSYFGIAYIDKNLIKINIVLNAKFDRQDDVLRFIVYHEMLHIELGKRHDHAFYMREGIYKDSAEMDAILDSLNAEYDIPKMKRMVGY